MAADATDRRLAFIAAGLAYLVAVLHLFHPTHGFARLVLVLSVDPGLLATDPRPLGFVLLAGAILLAVPAVLRGLPWRPVAWSGVGLLTLALVGYFAWHFSGHGAFLPTREPSPHRGIGPVENVILHLSTDPWAAGSVICELALLGLLVVLLYRRE